MMYRFDSDYLEGCLPEILDLLRSTNLEQTPGYGEDPYCTEAAGLIKAACNAPEAEVHFLVGGTQANATVISSLLRPHQGVLCPQSGHINVHESGAVEHTGHKVLALPARDGKISAGQIRKALHDHYDDFSREHMVQPGMVYISFPTEKGTLYGAGELEAISKVCRESGIPLFIDGARMGYGLSSPECELDLPGLARLADVFYIGGTKQGALFGEAVVFTDKSLARDFRYNIKQNGGMLAKGRLLGLQFKALFTDGLYLKAAGNAVRLARRLRDALTAKGVAFAVDSPTNQQFPILPDTFAEKLRRRFSFETWERVDEGHCCVRFCTSWATREEAVEALIDEFKEYQQS